MPADLQTKSSIRLHIGCGEKYLPGYVNIDYPPSEHTVMKVKADVYHDIRTLDYPAGSIAEIRSHHLFEHFSRAQALKLLARWRGWLEPDGLLIVETPDFGACVRAYFWAWSRRRRFQVGRHVFGSQEAKWAIHYDFWDKPKFKYVLAEMGFKGIRVRRYANGLAKHFPKYYLILNVVGSLLPPGFYRKYGSNKLPNILVTARRDGRQINYRAVAREIFLNYLAGRETDNLVDVWLKDFDAA